MKRAIIITITVIAVVLVCPSTSLLAKSPPKDAPTKSILPPTGDIPLPPWITDDDPGDGGDPGDMDDLAGNREGKDKSKPTGLNDAGLPSLEARFIVRIWWMFFMIRLF